MTVDNSNEFSPITREQMRLFGDAVDRLRPLMLVVEDSVDEVHAAAELFGDRSEETPEVSPVLLQASVEPGVFGDEISLGTGLSLPLGPTVYVNFIERAAFNVEGDIVDVKATKSSHYPSGYPEFATEMVTKQVSVISLVEAPDVGYMLHKRYDYYPQEPEEVGYYESLYRRKKVPGAEWELIAPRRMLGFLGDQEAVTSAEAAEKELPERDTCFDQNRYEEVMKILGRLSSGNQLNTWPKLLPTTAKVVLE